MRCRSTTKKLLHFACNLHNIYEHSLMMHLHFFRWHSSIQRSAHEKHAVVVFIYFVHCFYSFNAIECNKYDRINRYIMSNYILQSSVGISKHLLHYIECVRTLPHKSDNKNAFEQAKFEQN